MPFSLFCVQIVLVEPSHPGNVGATARAMKTMGLRRLVLVNPRLANVCEHPEAQALACGAIDVLREATIVDTLGAALAPVSLAVGLTARSRDLGPAVTALESFCQALPERTATASEIAFVFGCERTGLSNADLLLCHYACTINCDAEHASLNVAQAVQIVCYELRRSLQTQQPQATKALKPADQWASAEAVEQFLDHFEQALLHIDYLDPAHPKKLLPRLRRLFTRAHLTISEVDLLRGVCRQMLALNKPMR